MDPDEVFTIKWPVMLLRVTREHKSVLCLWSPSVAGIRTVPLGVCVHTFSLFLVQVVCVYTFPPFQFQLLFLASSLPVPQSSAVTCHSCAGEDPSTDEHVFPASFPGREGLE